MKITVYRSISNDMYEKLELDLEDEDIIKIGERFLELKRSTEERDSEDNKSN